MAGLFLVGLLVLAFAPETRGRDSRSNLFLIKRLALLARESLPRRQGGVRRGVESGSGPIRSRAWGAKRIGRARGLGGETPHRVSSGRCRVLSCAGTAHLDDFSEGFTMSRSNSLKTMLATALVLLEAGRVVALAADEPARVTVVQTPDGGIQPQAVIDKAGRDSPGLLQGRPRRGRRVLRSHRTRCDRLFRADPGQQPARQRNGDRDDPGRPGHARPGRPGPCRLERIAEGTPREPDQGHTDAHLAVRRGPDAHSSPSAT